MSSCGRPLLLRRGLRMEYATRTWNVVGIGVLADAAKAARSVALGGFGLDNLIEIGASTVVIWELKGGDEGSQHRAIADRPDGLRPPDNAEELMVASI